jgi:dihydrofolate reductase
MARVVVSEFVSLDGVMEDPGGAEGYEHGGWAFRFDRGEEGNRFKLEELMVADAQLLGRVTYEGFAAAWPSRSGDEFAQKMNEMPKYVISSTLQSAGWNNSHVLRGELGEEVESLRERHEGDILVAGSATLVRELTARGLVDEYRLMVFPILLGAGKRLFDGTGAPRSLELVEAATAGDVLTARFRPAAIAG